jgi:cytochrome c peroxidase
MVFKTSTMRNVALTAPCFHDGKIKTLPEAVQLMGKLQLDVELTEQEVKDITSFLEALTDKTREK